MNNVGQEIKRYMACDYCPDLGNHVHYNGETRAIPDGEEYLDVMTFNGIETFKL